MPSTEGRVGELGVDQVTQNCILRTDLPARAHSLGFVIDEQRQVLEMNETNNTALLAVPPLGTGLRWYLARAKDGYLRETASYSQITTTLS